MLLDNGYMYAQVEMINAKEILAGKHEEKISKRRTFNLTFLSIQRNIY